MLSPAQSNKSLPLVSIIILNWNGLADTIKCLESFRQVNYPNYQIFLVDNGSNGDDADVIEHKFGHEITLIRNQENKGFPGGNNQILTQIKDYNFPGHSLLLNNDTEVAPDFLHHLVQALETESQVGAVTAKLFNSDGSLQRSLRQFPTHSTTFITYCFPKFLFSAFIKKLLTKNRLLQKFLGRRTQSYFWDFDSDEPQDINNASGACLMVHNDILHSVGALDEKIFLSFEDVDWCYRIKQAGWRILYVPTAKITHHVGKSTKKGVEKLIYICYQIESKMYFAKKHFSTWDKLVTRLILFLALTIRLPLVIYYTIFSQSNQSNFKQSIHSRYWQTCKKIFT